MSIHSILDKDIFDVVEIKKVLEKNPSEVNSKSKNFKLYYGHTPLERVLRYKKSSVELVKLLLDYGADVSKDAIGDTPLLLIAIYKKRSVEIIQALLDAGSRADRQCHGSSVLCTALESEVPFDVIKLLVEKVGPLNRCNTHKSVMHCAIDGQIPGFDPKVLELLLNKGADLNKKDCDGDSVLCCALGRGPEDSDVELLLKAGAPVDACTRHPSALFCGISNLTESIIKQLLAAGASPNAVDEQGRTVLHIALKGRCKTGSIRALLDQVIDVNSVNKKGQSLLHIACANRNIDINVIRLLLGRGARLDVKDRYNQTPLHCAVKKRVGFEKGTFFSILDLLLKDDPPINAVDDNGETVLMIAVNRRRGPDLLHALLLAGARLGDTKENIKKFLQYALKKYRRKVMSFRYPVSRVLIRFAFLEGDFTEHEMLDCIQNNYFEPDSESFWEYDEQDEGRYRELPKFVKDCFLEVKKMESEKIGPDCSVRDFVCGNKNYDLDLLLGLNPFETFGIYSIAISHRLGKSVMIDKLNTLKIFAIEDCPKSSEVQKRVVLNCDSVCALSRYLSEVDLLRLILAFPAPSDYNKSVPDVE